MMKQSKVIARLYECVEEEVTDAEILETARSKKAESNKQSAESEVLAKESTRLNESARLLRLDAESLMRDLWLSEDDRRQKR